MHFYAYLEYHKFLKESDRQEVGFFQSKSGYSPLDISLKMNFERCIETIYKITKRLSRKNVVFLSILESSFIRINKSTYSGASKFYKFALSKSIDSRLPKFCNSTKKFPIIVFSLDPLTSKSSFMKNEEYSNDGIGINFKQTYFRLHMVPGSIKSLKVIKSIIESNNDALFSTEFIQLVLDEKWKRVKIVHYLQALMYAIYLFCVSYYSVNGGNMTLLIAFIANASLIVYEVFQLICEGTDYFKDA